MKKLALLAVFAAFSGLVFSGCGRTENPVENHLIKSQTSRSFENANLASLAPADITLAGFQVHYTGRTVSSGFTTFSYTVTGPAVDMHFRLELPACAPALSSLSPSNGTTTNNDAYINPGV